MENMPYGRSTLERCYRHLYDVCIENHVSLVPAIIDMACEDAWTALGERADARYNAKMERLSSMVDDVAMYAFRAYNRKYGSDLRGRVVHNWNQWKTETGAWRIGCAHFCRSMCKTGALPLDVLRIVAGKCNGCREAMWNFTFAPPEKSKRAL